MKQDAPNYVKIPEIRNEMKNNRALRQDGITSQMLKLGEEITMEAMKTLLSKCLTIG